MKTIKKKVFLLGLLLIALSVHSQDENSEMVSITSLERLIRLDLGTGGLGLSCELPLAEKLTLESGLGFGPGFQLDSEHFRFKPNFDDPSLYMTLHCKYYWDREKRYKKGKTLANNTGSFFGAQVRYNSSNFFSDLDGDPVNNIIFTNVHAGCQHLLSDKFVCTVYLGIGGAYEPYWSEFRVYPAIDVKFSYLF
ncbi:MAG: hypothetical protein LIO93_10275 [Bacteroidales bacterium]|nr:hypothetical protein [Bacteroidales bacterium]